MVAALVEEPQAVVQVLEKQTQVLEQVRVKETVQVAV
jgi:hypothetical protein|tara:strand:- start:185 stop:295 length:111 start_codon:yes stop_codon:yes gene_type:complete